MIALDTHVAVWLHAGETQFFSEGVLSRIDSESLVICPMVALELEYLYEIGRITVPSDTIVSDLSASLGLEVCNRPFLLTVRQALQVKWTRDPFDRTIVAHALAHSFDLLTKDEMLLNKCALAFWEG